MPHVSNDTPDQECLCEANLHHYLQIYFAPPRSPFIIVVVTAIGGPLTVAVGPIVAAIGIMKGLQYSDKGGSTTITSVAVWLSSGHDLINGLFVVRAHETIGRFPSQEGGRS